MRRIVVNVYERLAFNRMGIRLNIGSVRKAREMAARMTPDQTRAYAILAQRHNQRDRIVTTAEWIAMLHWRMLTATARSWLLATSNNGYAAWRRLRNE